MSIVKVDSVGLGDRVRAARQQHNLSVEALAFRAGMTPGHLSRLERGKVEDPGYRLMSRLAVVLGYSGADAMIGEPVVTESEVGQLLEARLGITPDAEARLAELKQLVGEPSEVARLEAERLAGLQRQAKPRTRKGTRPGRVVGAFPGLRGAPDDADGNTPG